MVTGLLTPLDKKLVRDLWRLRGQVLAIALVIASGMAILIMSLSTTNSLNETARAYYDRYRFADVFADMRRAPESMMQRISAIPGVQLAESGITQFARLEIAGFDEPVTARFQSLPDTGSPLLNLQVLRDGQLPAAGRDDEALISEPFALEHNLGPGDFIFAILDGHQRKLRISGTALSPEHVYTMAPGALMPDNKRFGIIWMRRPALAAAFDLDGAFNSVSLTLARGASGDMVLDQLDRILDPWGGTGGYLRKDQQSHWFLMNEITQLENMALILPAAFLLVSAFLSHMVLSRLIATERSEIGLLKAFGYSNTAIAWQYVKLVLAICAIGGVLGIGLGSWFGWSMTNIYADLFNFPFLIFRPSPEPYLLSMAISIAAALAGTLMAVRQAVALPPAEAMQPPAPPVYRTTGITTGRLTRLMDQQTRIILRQILRWPVRAFFTMTGVGLAIGLMVVGLQWVDAIDHLLNTMFHQSQRQDMTVTLNNARSSKILYEIKSIDGVLDVEPSRVLAARFRHGNRQRRESLTGIVPNARLWPIYDAAGGIVSIPEQGLVLSLAMAQVLQARIGDMIEVEILEENRPRVVLPVAHIFDTYLGKPVYMHFDAVNRLMGNGPAANMVQLRIDQRQEQSIYNALKDRPAVAGITVKRHAVDMFNKTLGETMLAYVSIFTAFSCALAFGVVYNSARIALSERGRDLATLRVLGFGQNEVAFILLGEMVLLSMAALPLGCLIGYGLAGVMVDKFATELFRIPFLINADSFGLAMITGLAATLASAILVRRRLSSLDLIEVLKTRE